MLLGAKMHKYHKISMLLASIKWYFMRKHNSTQNTVQAYELATKFIYN